MNPTVDTIEILKNVLIAASTNGGFDQITFADLRQRLLNDAATKSRLPPFMRTCRNLAEVRAQMQLLGGYHERRKHIRDSFAPLLDHLEGLDDAAVSRDTAAARLDTWESVSAAWTRAQERSRTDPEAAVTSARELLESVCKCVLDEANISYSHDADLPKLYRLAAGVLKLAPDQHLEEVFKQILGGCKSVVEGLGALRNRVGDAHGKGIRPVRPKERHAALAVNLAGAVAIFMIETRDARRGTAGAPGR